MGGMRFQGLQAAVLCALCPPPTPVSARLATWCHSASVLWAMGVNQPFICESGFIPQSTTLWCSPRETRKKPQACTEELPGPVRRPRMHLPCTETGLAPVHFPAGLVKQRTVTSENTGHVLSRPCSRLRALHLIEVQRKQCQECRPLRMAVQGTDALAACYWRTPATSALQPPPSHADNPATS